MKERQKEIPNERGANTHLQKPIQLILTALRYRHHAEHEGGEDQEANIMHCAEDCGRGGAQEGRVDRAWEGMCE
jgi:hypothetical protein